MGEKEHALREGGVVIHPYDLGRKKRGGGDINRDLVLGESLTSLVQDDFKSGFYLTNLAKSFLSILAHFPITCAGPKVNIVKEILPSQKGKER